MSNLRILANNLHDSAAVSVDSAPAMPVEYTQDSVRSHVWRSVDQQVQVITATLSVAGFVDCVAIARHNLGASGVVKVELLIGEDVVHTSGDITMAMIVPAGVWRAGIDPWGATYNERMPGGSELGIYWLPGPLRADGYRITISGSNPDGYFEIGRIFSGLSFAPSVNMNWGCQVSWVESGEHVRTEGQSLRTVGGGDLWREFGVKLDWITEEDRQRLVTEVVRAGLGADLLVSLYPQSGGLKELEHTMICRRVQGFSHSHSHVGNWQASLDFREV